VDSVVTVSEEEIALSILRLMEMQKFVIEGAGATGLAALLDKDRIPGLRGKRVAIPLCGGNIDAPVLGRVIERGLASDHRLVRFSAKVPDRPGGGARLHSLIGEVGANVKDIYLERAHLKASVMTVQNTYLVEVRNLDHWKLLRQRLEEAGFEVIRTEDY
jgi:threonine dehydratase